MAIISKSLLKTFFETGDIPTQANFEDLIDTLGNTSLSEGSINNVAIGMDTPAEAQFSSVNVVGDPINDSLVISQSGSGNSLVIENSSDANSPLIVDKNGNMNIGSTTFYDDRKIFSKQTVTSPIQSEYNTFVQLTVNNQSGSDNKTALFGYASPGTSFNTSSKIIGVGGQSSHNYNRTNTNLIGVNCTTGAASGSSGSINQQTGLNVETFTNLGTATINNIYGVAIANQTNTATNIYSLYSDQASAANKWNIFANGTAKNYFRGSVLIGSSTDDGVNSLQVTGSSKFTNKILVDSSMYISHGSGNQYTNIAIGTSTVLNKNTTGTSNIGIGYDVLSENLTGVQNTIIGHWSGVYLTGHYNTAYGAGSLSRATSVDELTAYGAGSCYWNSTGTNNTGIGTYALYNNKTGMGNTALGYRTLYNNLTSGNTAVGYLCLSETTSASENTGVGYSCLVLNTTGSRNTAIGAGSLQLNTTGSRNTAIGASSLFLNKTGYDNIAVGHQAQCQNNSGSYNIAIGNESMYFATNVSNNIGIGYNTLHYNSSGSYNIGIGKEALYKNTSGGNSTAVGYQSLYNNTTGYNNTAIGTNSLYANTTGYSNTALGLQSLYNNVDGYSNTAIGLQSLDKNTNGSENIALGNFAGTSYGAWGYDNKNSSKSLFIGCNTRAFTSNGTNEMVFGDRAIGLGSNTCTLGNNSILKTFLRGNVIINSETDDTLNKLQVNGSAKASQWNVTAMATAPASASDTGTLGEVRVTSDYIYVCVATNTWKRTALTTW